MTTSSSSETIDLGECAASRSLLTRDQGSDLREKVLLRLATARAVVLDLTRVDALSPSFADELFGGLEAELGPDFKQRVRISCPRSEWKRLIASALTHRRREEARVKVRASVA
jgi:hypothetical protein